MKKIKRFKNFKKRKKSVIRKFTDKPYNWVPTYNQNSPAPAENQITMKNSEMDLNISI